MCSLEQLKEDGLYRNFSMLCIQAVEPQCGPDYSLCTDSIINLGYRRSKAAGIAGDWFRSNETWIKERVLHRKNVFEHFVAIIRN